MKVMYIVLFVLVFCLFFIIPFALRANQVHPITFVTPTINDYQFVSPPPPSQAMIGQISNIIGNVIKAERYTSATSSAVNNSPLLQCENLKTGQNSQVTLTLMSQLSATLEQNAALSLTNSLLPNILITQTDGQVIYQIASSSASIRTLHLLIRPALGRFEVTKNDNDILLIGSGQAAYEDRNNTTHLITLREDRRFYFDDIRRTYRFIR